MAGLMRWLNDWLGFFKPLQVRNLQIFWSGQACALIGMWLQVTAMGILVYDISGGSATAVGLLAALNALPFFWEECCWPGWGTVLTEENFS